MDDSAGLTWRAVFHGEDGNDRLVGSTQDDELDGGDGNDTWRAAPATTA
jgi:Ca2+-binding RTX toxin-like protein